MVTDVARFYNARIGTFFTNDVVVSFQMDTLRVLSPRLNVFRENSFDQMSIAPSCWEMV